MKIGTIEKENVVVDEEENLDGSGNETNQESNDTGLEQGGEENINAGGETGETGEGGKGNEDEAGEIADPRDKEISDLKARLDGIEKGSQKEEPVRPWTDEQWTSHTESTGLTKEATRFMGQLISHAMKIAMSNTQGMADQLSVFQKDSAITALSREKGFEDIAKYREGVYEFLQDYSPSYHTDKDTLKKAYFYSRGKVLSGAIKKASNSIELNKRVISRAGMQQSGGKTKEGGNSTSSFKLTDTEESAWSAFSDKFKSKDEYVKSLPRFKNKK